MPFGGNRNLHPEYVEQFRGYCGSCAHFDPLNADEGTGECRALPPKPRTHTDDDSNTAEWPIVSEGEWCGAWLPGWKS